MGHRFAGRDGGLLLVDSRIGIEARWGDVHSGMAFERARLALLKLEKEPVHAKNWRPIILALGAASSGRRRILEFGQWLTAGRGVLSLGQVVSEGSEDRIERGEKIERVIRQTISEEGIEAFPAVVVDDDLLDGLKSLLLCHGIGGVRPNTVLLGWSRTRTDSNVSRIFCDLASDCNATSSSSSPRLNLMTGRRRPERYISGGMAAGTAR